MIEPVAIPSGPDVVGVLPRLAAALAGHGPVLPYAVSSSSGPPPAVAVAAARAAGEELPDGAAVVVGTSGSTGTPKLAVLTAAALTASADATHERLGGPGQWLLALPAHHIAGLQVLLRGIRAGTAPAVQDVRHGFDPAVFAATVAAMDAALPRYASLVPAQLVRVLADLAASRAAASLTAVLLGGQAVDPQLRDRASAAGIRVVTTYGMSETCGGCVYDGVPLHGVRVAVEPADGRIRLGGATLASGYLGDPGGTAAAFEDVAGQRWFRTDDHGRLGVDGRLRVVGRLDDLVNTGGLKIAPRLVEEALRAHLPGVVDACVVGVPDPLWGEAVAAALVLAEDRGAPLAAPEPTVAEVRERLRGILPDHALPHVLRIMPGIPCLGPGKPDRGAVQAALRMGQ